MCLQAAAPVCTEQVNVHVMAAKLYADWGAACAGDSGFEMDSKGSGQHLWGMETLQARCF